MTIDLSTVKRIAAQCGYEELELFLDIRIKQFAKACYAMGAAEQKEKDIKICESLNSTISSDATRCAEAIRYNE